MRMVSRVVWRPWIRWLVIVFGWLGAPATVHAHSSLQGLGDFVSGLVHPLTTPSHVLIVIGLGLLAGRSGGLSLKTTMAVFLPASAAGLLLTTTGGFVSVYPPVLLCIALAAGTLLALDRRLPSMASGALLAAGALAMGLDSAVTAGSPMAVAKTLLGNWTSLALLVCDIAIYVSMGRQAKWLQIALRVAGSWIVAVSLMVLAFSLRGGGNGPAP